MSMPLPSCNGAMPSSSPFFPPNFILQMQSSNSSHDHLLNPHDFSSRGVPTMVSDACEGEEEISDDCSQPGEKKRRLSIEQVRTLEKNFELGNKLEPERKIHLARSLGLQPRQIAIWFQNRRARWKTKQLEKDYDSLKRQFDAIKAENDDLRSNNKKLHSEIISLRGREVTELINLNKETEGSSSNRSDNSSEINLDMSRTSAAGANIISDNHLSHHLQNIPFFSVIRPPGITQLFPRPDLQCGKMENSTADENFSNLLCSMDDQNAFWPWPDHHNLN